MFVDSDDALLPDALERMFEEIVDEDIIIGGYTTYIGGIPGKEVLPLKACSYRGVEMASFFDDNIKRNCEMLDAPWSKMFRRKTVGDLRFCEDLSYAEDKLFVFTFFSKCRFAHTCPVPVYAYHIRPGSLGSDVVSDRHLMQLRRFIPAYTQALTALTDIYPASVKLNALYHKDVVGRYCCRILNIFLKRSTALLNEDYLGWVYSVMSADQNLGVLSLRTGQIPNILLFKAGNPAMSIRIYKMFSCIYSILHA